MGAGASPPGRPFQPGISGNPGGRPKGFAGIIREQTREGAELVEFVLSVLRDTKAKRADRIAAATWLADRGFGKPKEPVELSGSAGPIIFESPLRPGALRDDG